MFGLTVASTNEERQREREGDGKRNIQTKNTHETIDRMSATRLVHTQVCALEPCDAQNAHTHIVAQPDVYFFCLLLFY